MAIQQRGRPGAGAQGKKSGSVVPIVAAGAGLALCCLGIGWVGAAGLGAAAGALVSPWLIVPAALVAGGSVLWWRHRRRSACPTETEE